MVLESEGVSYEIKSLENGELTVAMWDGLVLLRLQLLGAVCSLSAAGVLFPAFWVLLGPGCYVFFFFCL
jgi:hypothetical protein